MGEKLTRGERIRATLGNWRWWVAVVLFAWLWLAVAAVYWILWGVQLAAEWTMDELEYTWTRAVTPLRRWVYGRVTARGGEG